MSGLSRVLVLSALFIPAAPHAAQAQTLQAQVEDLRLQQEAAQRRAIDQQNQLMALESRLRAEQAAQDLQRGAPSVPLSPYDPTRVPPSAGPSRYPAIPDRALADSNRRVQDVVRGSR